MTAFSWDFGRALEPGTIGVQTLRKRQFSLPLVDPVWTHCDPNFVASMVLGPVKAVGYVHRAGGSAKGMPWNLKDLLSRKLEKHIRLIALNYHCAGLPDH